MKVLVVRLSSIGDVVHTTPMVVALVKAGHEVAWAVEPPAAPLVASIKGLAHTFILPKASAYDWNDRFRIARTLRDFNPDVAIDAQGLWKSAFWTWLSGAPRRIGWRSDHRREASSSSTASGVRRIEYCADAGATWNAKAAKAANKNIFARLAPFAFNIMAPAARS